MARERGSRLKSVRAALVAGLATGALPGTAVSSTPSLMWAGARNVAVHCLVRSMTTRNPVEFERALCDRVRSLASARSRMPVKIVEAGDPALIRGDTVVLLVHASVEQVADGRMIAFAIRPYRPSGGDAEVYFGAAPRALVTRGALTSPALDTQILAAVSEILPPLNPAAKSARPL